MSVNVGALPATLGHQDGRFHGCSCTSLQVAERRAAVSTTAGRRFGSCPTCPRALNLCSLMPRGSSLMWVRRPLFHPLTYHQEHHRRSLRVANLVMDFLAPQPPL